MDLFYNLSFKLLLVTMVALLVIMGRHSYLSLAECREAEDTHSQLNNQIFMLKQENHELKEEATRLVNDMSYYEQLGREVFGMVKEDEVVYIVPLP